MRTVVIVVFALVAATPAYASKSCMTLTEARQQFATSHLYWHGADHCWDATPTRHRLARVKPSEDQQARRDDREVNSQEPKWRNAMSEMLPGDAPIEAPSAAAVLAISETPCMNWLDRWVDVAQVASPAFNRKDGPADIWSTAVRKADPMTMPVHLILMFLGFVMTLAFIELLFNNLIHDWRR